MNWLLINMQSIECYLKRVVEKWNVPNDLADHRNTTGTLKQDNCKTDYANSNHKHTYAVCSSPCCNHVGQAKVSKF